MRQRLSNDPATERGAALQQINRIAGFRLDDCVAQESSSAASAAQ
jgi:2-oxo-4-hydroxy-4-carboxy--5-ureidoimidazoline (OHCU) decarboxylase